MQGNLAYFMMDTDNFKVYKRGGGNLTDKVGFNLFKF